VEAVEAVEVELLLSEELPQEAREATMAVARSAAKILFFMMMSPFCR
jgi:hypothetical protein